MPSRGIVSNLALNHETRDDDYRDECPRGGHAPQLVEGSPSLTISAQTSPPSVKCVLNIQDDAESCSRLPHSCRGAVKVARGRWNWRRVLKFVQGAVRWCSARRSFPQEGRELSSLAPPLSHGWSLRLFRVFPRLSLLHSPPPPTHIHTEEGCTEMGKDGNKYPSLGKYLGFENSSNFLSLRAQSTETDSIHLAFFLFILCLWIILFQL